MQNRRRKTSSPDGQKLRDWLDSIPFGIYNNVTQRIVDECKVKRHTIANWIYINKHIPPLTKERLNLLSLEISGRKIYDEV